ncbi:hypothetical protein Tco_0958967 [Tanacetum coccineum]
MLNKKKVSLDVDMFREILQFFPKVPGQEFNDLSLEHDILSFIRDLRHSGDIIYLTVVSVDYLHQPWRAFATFINKCLSGKEIGMDSIRLSHVSPNMKILKYMVPFSQKELTNQAMLESKAYKTCYAFASGEKTPKPKYVRKKVDSDRSPKQKPVQATKGTRLKTKAKETKSKKKKQHAKKPKSKGLAVLFEVALTEAEQLKLATKRSKTQFHSSHASGSGDGVDTQSKVPGEQHLKTTSADEGTGTIPGVLDVPIYESENTEIYNADQGTSEQQNVSQESGFKQVEEDAHVTLTPLLDTQKADEPNASLMDTTAQHATTIPEITSSFTITVPPPPHFFNPLSQQEIPTPTPTASETTTSLPALPDFASVFKFQ